MAPRVLVTGQGCGSARGPCSRGATFQEVEDEFALVSWLLQLLCSYCGPTVALVILAGVLGKPHSEAWQAVIPYAWQAVIIYVAIAALAVIWALGISAAVPGAAQEGSSVWALPAAVEIFFLIWALCWRGFYGARLMFYVSPSEGGEAGWGLGLLTLPTWGCCCYSAVMHWRWRRRGRTGCPTAQPRSEHGLCGS